MANLTIGLSAAILATASARGEVTRLEPLEVTAQKRAQSLQDVPIALTAYTGTFLESSGITQLRELAPFVPGLFIQEQSPNYPGINLRGITTDDNDPRTEARVSIFLDGVSTSRATANHAPAQSSAIAASATAPARARRVARFMPARPPRRAPGA